MNSAMKTVGVSLAVGTAAKKAANTINTIVDNMQDMIK